MSGDVENRSVLLSFVNLSRVHFIAVQILRDF